MGTVEVRGLRIVYERAGDGPPLVLFHGGMEDRRSWRWQFDELCEHYAVYAWDAPGCGGSAEPPETWRMSDYADCAAEWLRILGVERPHTLGLSWGSTIVLELYRRHPALPASLVLVGAYAGWAGSLSSEAVRARLESVLAAGLLPDTETAAAWPGLLSAAATPEMIGELAPMWSDNSAAHHPVGYRTMALSMAEADLRDVLPRIDVPTLLLYGEIDERSPLSVAEALHERIPGSELVVIPGVGHLVNAEAPAAFNAAVHGFLQRVAS